MQCIISRSILGVDLPVSELPNQQDREENDDRSEGGEPVLNESKVIFRLWHGFDDERSNTHVDYPFLSM